MINYVILGIVVLGAVWYFKNKKNKSQTVNEDSQEESTESCCSKHSEDKVESLESPIKLDENLKNEKLEGVIITPNKLEVTAINLPIIIEARAPNDCTLDNLKELAKEIYSQQVEPLSYPTIYKYIADHYGYRTWKDFKKILETK